MVPSIAIERKIKEAVSVLKTGGVVVFPTETAYGLAADATNSRAVERVAAIKGREGWKTPPLIVADRAMADRYAQITPVLDDLARRFWPGSLTIVAGANIPPLPDLSAEALAKAEGISPLPEGGLRGEGEGVGEPLADRVVRDGTIALRVSSYPIARTLSEKLGFPIVATSANRAGGKECYRVEDVRAQFASQLLQPDFYLDVGPLEPRPPSTIVREVEGRI